MATKWTTVTFGEVVTLAQGLCFNAKSNHLMAKTGIPLLRIADLINNTQTKFVDAERVPKKYISNPNDIIYTRTGQVGLVFKGKVGVVHNNCFRVIPQDGVEADYVYWYLTQPSVIEKARSLASGAAQPDLGHDAFKSISFIYPEPSVQRRIGAILSAYDELMENSQRRIRLLEAMARALYREWFVYFRFPGHETHPRVASPLGDIPQGWEIALLASLVDFAKGRKPAETRPEPLPGDVKLLLIDSLHGGEAVFTAPVKLVLAETRDTIMVMDGASSCEVTIGSSGAVGSTLGRFRTTQPDRFSPHTLYRFLEAKAEEFKSKNIGAAIPHANKDYILTQSVALPPKAITASFNAHIEPIQCAIETLKLQIQNLRRMRDLLLPRLLSGQIEIGNN